MEIQGFVEEIDYNELHFFEVWLTAYGWEYCDTGTLGKMVFVLELVA